MTFLRQPVKLAFEQLENRYLPSGAGPAEVLSQLTSEQAAEATPFFLRPPLTAYHRAASAAGGSNATGPSKGFGFVEMEQATAPNHRFGGDRHLTGGRGAAKAPGDQASLFLSEDNVLYASGTNNQDFITFEQIGHPLDENVIVATIMNEFGQVLAADVFENVIHVFAQGHGGSDVIDNATFIDATLYGDEGNDRIRGGADSDMIYGGLGADWLDGADGVDWLFGDDGNDVLLGGYGADRLYGGADHDKLFGEDGADTLYGEGGTDYMFGGDGADTLYGGAGSDYLNGGSPDTLPAWGTWAPGFNINDYLDTIHGQIQDGELDELWGGSDADLFVNAAHWYQIGTTDEGISVWANIAEDLVMDADYPLDGINILDTTCLGD